MWRSAIGLGCRFRTDRIGLLLVRAVTGPEHLERPCHCDPRVADLARPSGGSNLGETTSCWLLISCRNSQRRELPASNTEESARNPIGNRFRVAASFAAAVLYHSLGSLAEPQACMCKPASLK